MPPSILCHSSFSVFSYSCLFCILRLAICELINIFRIKLEIQGICKPWSFREHNKPSLESNITCMLCASFAKTKWGSETFCGQLNFYNYHWLPWTFTMLATRQAVLDAVLVTSATKKLTATDGPSSQVLVKPLLPLVFYKGHWVQGNSCWQVSVPF